MICRRCLQRASALSSRILPAQRAATPSLPFALRPFSSTLPYRSSSPAPQPPPAGASAPGPAETQGAPEFSTPLADSPGSSSSSSDGAAGSGAEPLSACPEGTVLSGLNYFKNRTDPVALADDAYPAWLWQTLEVQKRADEDADDDAGDEFSKSKKQRRLAAKRQRALEARLLAEGNIEALAPKIPLQHQSVNMPGNEEGTTEGAIAAQQAREDLRRAMRKERKAKIKESNYLKSM
ncbi:Uu.00g044370.m01.CDS01 [Anthostomella pinea]|uniref:Large ribosomal subunit protein mL54 n=1 Tax=Anthostomella pinea TaxID=933095 RepID=A0AAI8YBX0_9PEZI|nr:Uu.00g044370.m01.CDS01 [Anthostomella pinea]